MSEEMFTSKQEKWVAIGYNLATAYNVYKYMDAVEAIKRANDILNSGPQDLGGGINFPYNERYAEELYEQWQDLCKFSNGIHYEVADFIEVPFTQKMGRLLDDLYSLQPKNFKTDKLFGVLPIGSSLDELLIDMVENAELKKSYEALIDTLKNDEIEATLEETIAVANYWADQFEKAERIQAIAEEYMTLYDAGWENYSEEERLDILNEYATQIGTILNEKEGEKQKEAQISVDWDINDPEYSTDANQKLENGSAAWFMTNGTVNGQIYVNYEKTNDSSSDLEFVLETVTHEVRHLYQGQAYYEGDRFGVPESIEDEWKISDKKEDDKEDGKEFDYWSYWLKPREMDARAFASVSQAY